MFDLSTERALPYPLRLLLTELRVLWSMRRFDVLYMRLHVLLLPIQAIAWVVRVPVVLEINGPTEDVVLAYPRLRPALRLLSIASKLQLRLASAHVVVTPQLGQWLENQIGERHHLVAPNGADVDHFSPEGEFDPPVDGEYVCFFGALARWQGLPTLLEAVSSDAWPKDLTLVIIGDGELASLVSSAAARSGNIVPLGPVPYDGLPAKIRGAVASIVSSEPRAGSGVAPIKLAESLAAGLPVVVTDVPGMADIVKTHDCGEVFAQGDAAALARAVARLAALAPSERSSMAARARDAATRSLSWASVAERTHAFLGEVANRTGEQRLGPGRSASYRTPSPRDANQ